MPASWLLLASSVALWAHSATATPLQQPFWSCLDRDDDLIAPANQLLNFTTLWTQFDTGQDGVGVQGEGVGFGGQQKDIVRATLVGTTGAQSEGFSNQTNYLATLITDASVLNFQTFFNQSALCASIRTPTFDGTGGPIGVGTNPNASSVSRGGCPYGPGDIALGVDIPLAHAYPLTTISTKIRILDTSTPALTLGCVDIEMTPYYPQSYFYRLMLWIPVAAAIGYIVVCWAGRIWASKVSEQLDREMEVASSLTNKLSDGGLLNRLGVTWWHAWSGQGLLLSGALLRFATPGARDILWHTQFVTSLGMIAVRWPGFAYPVLAKGAWSTLIYNVTLLSGQDANDTRLDPLRPPPFDSPSQFTQQIADPASPLFLDQNLPNVLLNLGNHTDGMERWAIMTGLRPQDLFPTCLIIFLGICAGIVALAGIFYVVDILTSFARTPTSKHLSSVIDPAEEEEGLGYPRSNGLVAGGQSGDAPAHTPWWQVGRKLTLKGGKRASFNEKGLMGGTILQESTSPNWRNHAALLQGNLTRVLLLFYYPIVIFSVYHFTLSSTVSTSSIALAGFSFALLGLLLPALQIWRVRRHAVPRTRSGELVDDLPTILALGPLYNTFAEKNELFMAVRLLSALISGIVIGAAQSQGLAQAVVMLCVELAETSMTSLWLPWGDGAAMGPLAFVLSVTRIITAVLLIVLSPTVGVGLTAAGWLTYVVLILQGIIYTLAVLILLVKLVEFLFRVFAHVPFEETRSSRSGGLRGAIRRWDRGGGRTSRHKRAANIAAQRRRGARAPSSILSSGRPRSRASASVMLDLKNNHSNPALGRASSMGSGRELYHQQMMPFTDDDGYIMSAMSKGPWVRASATPSDFGEGYVAPGQYSARPPNHRQSLSWQDQVGSPAQSSGFSVVRGGRATEEAPWQMGGAAGRRGDREYPPYGHQASPSAGSLARTDEWAAPGGAGDRLAKSRTATGHVGKAAAAGVAGVAAGRASKGKQKAGIMGMFGRRKRDSSLSEASSDDEDFEDEVEDSGAKGGRWSLPKLGWKKKGAGEWPSSPVAGKSFEVIRQPRPKPSPQPSSRGHEEAGPSNSSPRHAPLPTSEPQEQEELREDPFRADFGNTSGGSVPPGAARPVTSGPKEGDIDGRDLASRRGSLSDQEFFDATTGR